MPSMISASMRFQSTPPARRATRTARRLSCHRRGFNPRPPRGGRRAIAEVKHKVIYVSIHAPRAEGDALSGHARVSVIVSIHAPRAEGDSAVRQRALRDVVSIHAPRAEGDRSRPASSGGSPRFQSTPPARRATSGRYGSDAGVSVSIHAPRAEGDAKPTPAPVPANWFQSTPPARRATPSFVFAREPAGFQSTPPARRATGGRAFGLSLSLGEFQSTPPRGGRPGPRGMCRRRAHVSIHAPRAEGDSRWTAPARCPGSFNPRPPRGGRRS